jgi:hypothetical protein
MNRFLCAIALSAVLLPTAPLAAQGPLDDERPPGAEGEGGGYAWEDEEETAGPTQPSRLVLTIGGGSGLRLVKNITYDQQAFAPAYIDLMGAWVLPSAAQWRHGLGLTISTNITSDGSGSVGVDGFAQWMVAPTYLAYLRFGEDWLITGHAGVPLGISSDGEKSQQLIGLDVGAGAAFYLLAGFGIYVEASVSVWMGSEVSFHPILNYEGGFLIDYEVLP